MRRWTAILLGVLVLAAPLAAEAGCPAKPKNAVRAKRLAKKLFSKGGRLAQKEKYTQALDTFLCSLKMKNHENTVYNVAQVSKFVKDREVVRKRLETFLEKYPNHEARPELEELIASVDGTYTPPDNAELTAPVADPTTAEEAADEGAEDGAEEVATGPPEPGTEQPDEEEGPAGEVASLFAEDEKPPVEQPAEEPQPSAGDEGVPPTRVAGYVLLGTAGATLITAIALQGATGAAKNDALDASDYDQFTAREDKMKGLQTGATVFWVATGLLAGTGVVLLLLDTDETDDGAGGAELEVRAAPNGVALQGRF